MLFIKSKYFFFLFLICVILTFQSVSAVDVNVSTSSELLSALNNNQYDNIHLNDGSYEISNVTVSRSVSISASHNSTSISSKDGFIFNIEDTGSLSLTGLTIKDTNTQGSLSSSPIISSGNLSLTDCIFSNNKGASGGVLSVSDGLTSISNSVFTGNSGSNNGGVISQTGGTLSIMGSSFISNSASRLGGVINSQSKLTVSSSVFINNKAPVGAVLSSSVYCEVSNSRFNNNKANTSGGAIYSTGDLKVSGCYFNSNNASYGGAISISSQTGKTSNITGSTFISNGATSRIIVDTESYGGTGGAIYSEGEVNILQSIFDGNSALYDGGAISIYGEGSGIINYNIFLNNKARTPTVISADIIENMNLNYNWWGENNPFTNNNLIGSYNYTTDSYDYHTPENWIILTLNAANSMNTNSQTPVTSQLQVKTSKGNINTFTGNLPSNSITLSTTGGTINPSYGLITNTLTSTYTSPEATGVYTVSSKLDNEVVSIPIIVQPTIIVTQYDTSITPTNYTINPNEDITVNIISDFLTVNTGTLRLSENGILLSENSVNNGIVTVNLNLAYGTHTLNAEYLGNDPFKSSNAILTINVPSPEDNTILIMEDLTKYYLGVENLTGTLKTIYDEPVIGQHLNLTLTRLSNGASKTYDIVTDYTGTFSLPINLASGEYKATVNFLGFQNLTSASNTSNIHVLNPEDNRTKTYFNATDLVKNYTIPGNFNGTLLSENGTLIGQHVSLTLTRLSSGASKTYDSVTDYTGLFSLAINLAPGLYSVLCSFDGNSEYQSTSTSCTITVI